MGHLAVYGWARDGASGPVRPRLNRITATVAYKATHNKFRLLIPRAMELYSNRPPTMAPNKLYPNATLGILLRWYSVAKTKPARKTGNDRNSNTRIIFRSGRELSVRLLSRISQSVRINAVSGRRHRTGLPAHAHLCLATIPVCCGVRYLDWASDLTCSPAKTVSCSRMAR